MLNQCRYNLSSVWEAIPQTPDPYATPSYGNCAEKQLTQQGISNSKKLGTVIRSQYVTQLGLLHPACPTGSIYLESDNAQKNQQTIQNEYLGLCGRNPNPEEFARDNVMDDGVVAPGRPFYLSPAVCGGERYNKLMDEATKVMISSAMWLGPMKETAALLANITGHSFPPTNSWADLLDNIEDCVISHECHSLPDVPSPFVEDETLFFRTDALESFSRYFPLQYFKSKSTQDFYEFASLVYGYYYRVLHDRMKNKLESEDSTKLYIQVTSDNVLTLQLIMLGLDEAATVRPPWGSTIVYELYANSSVNGRYAVRVLFNGKVMRIPSCEEDYCTWEQFQSLISRLWPSVSSCHRFYDNYTPKFSKRVAMN